MLKWDCSASNMFTPKVLICYKKFERTVAASPLCRLVEGSKIGR